MPDVTQDSLIAGAMQRPHPALVPYVEPYVGYHDVLDPRAVHHGLPSAFATVILAFGEPIDSSWLDGDRSRLRTWTLAGGLHLRPALIRTHGFQHGIQLSLTPLGVRTLLGLPLAALTGCIVDHRDLPSGVPADVHARLADASTWSERFALLDDFLLGLAFRGREAEHAVQPDLRTAWQILTTSRGTARIGEVAARLGRSTRWLSERFVAEFGVTPKQAARLHRFGHARELARRTSLAQTAALAGYADQAHLAREWRDLAAQTPTQVLAEPFRIVQDEPVAADGS